MELETMFVDQKWNILKNLSANKHSPLQLATKSNTSIANISQQLRLLEAAHLVQKQKIPNRDKGKPRTLFSLTDNYAYLISTMNDFAEKKLLKLSDHNKAILKIWYLEDQELHYPLEKFFWKIEPNLQEIEGIAITKNGDTKLIVVSEKFDKKIDDLHVKTKTTERVVKVDVFDKKEFSKYLKKAEFSNLLVLYDPTSSIINLVKELQGGRE